MIITLEVTPVADQESEIRLQSFKHIECGRGDFHKFRNPVTNYCEFRCTCGLELGFENMGIAARTIMRTAIDSQQRRLPIGSYQTTGDHQVFVTCAGDILTLHSSRPQRLPRFPPHVRRFGGRLA